MLIEEQNLSPPLYFWSPILPFLSFWYLPPTISPMCRLLAASSTASTLAGLPVSPLASYKSTVNTNQQTIRCQLDNITSLLRTHQKPLLAKRIKSKLSTAGWKTALLASAYFFSFSALGHCLLVVP